MQPGARFAAQLSTSSDRSVCMLSDLEPSGRRAGGVTIYIGGIGRTLDHEATIIHDVTRIVATDNDDERFAALYDTTEGETILLEVANETVEIALIRPVPHGMRRVVAMGDRWYVASDAEVRVLAHRTAPGFELIAVDAIDLAVANVAPSGLERAHDVARDRRAPSRPSLRAGEVHRASSERTLLCVVDARGLTWFDHDGAVVERRAVTSPTAIAGDALAGGWLVAADGDVLQFASPKAAPVVLARGVGLATRVRRDVDTLYASLENGELVEVRGIRHGPTGATPRTIAAYARGFTEFDAGFALFVDEGSGPRRFDAT